ncbi:MAG: filamentous hemagglutinin N-terminal domain-containing protein [Rhizonema sp. PD38]|nr:filamentous hemagglutinin N-terminal domain-containing protein [Rhizonema sp. PD38]
MVIIYFMKTCLSQLCILSGSALFWLLSLYPVTAQIVPDRTLTNNSIVTPNGNRSIITGGTQAGKNLFHSFRDFSVPNSSEAFFNNLSDIQNIITRVTGGSISTINGSIRANSANLFFINPHGIIFGPNASLNIGGSFVASTASSIRFADGTEFSAINPQVTPLLTVSVPIGLQFGSNPGDIVNQSQASLNGAVNSNIPPGPAGLQVPSGKTLALVGGNVSLDNGNLTAAGGRIELGSVETGLVNLTQTPQGYALGYTGIQNFRDIQLSSAATVDASGAGGGAIQLTGRNINLTSAQIFSTTRGALPGGNLTINAAESVYLRNTGLSTLTSGAGSAGDLTLTTKSLRIEGGAAILSGTLNTGRGGNLTVDAAESINLSGSNSRLSTLTSGTGSAGNLKLTTRSLGVEGGAVIFSQTSGTGTAGNVTVDAAESVNLSGNNTQLYTVTSGTGSAGNLKLTTRSLGVEGGAAISSPTLGTGRGGNLTVDAAESVNLSGNNTQLSTATRGAGSAGNLKLTTRSLGVEGGAAISSQTSNTAAGTGGDVTVEAAESVNLSGNSTQLSTVTSGTGSAGNLTLTTRNLTVASGALIATPSNGQGRAGYLLVKATDAVELSGTRANGLPGGLSAQVTARGNGGNLTVETGQLTIQDGAAIDASTFGAAQAGNVFVIARDIKLAGFTTRNGVVQPSGIFAQVASSDQPIENAGSAGKLNIETQRLTVLNGAQISAAARYGGSGGDLTINASDSIRLSGTSPIVTLDGGRSGIFVSAQREATGNVGNLNITSRHLSVENGAIISANNLGTGSGGTLTVKAAESVDVIGKVNINSTSVPSSLSAVSRASGEAGDLNITTPRLNLQNGAEVSVSGLGSVPAGNLIVTANDIRLNQGSLTAISNAGGGANIKLENVNLLLLQDQSVISTQAFNTANGGNINIGARNGFVVAVPGQNSDIIANARGGPGGNISITASDIFGIEERSSNPPNTTNDIDASSQFNQQGTVTINRPEIDRVRGLVEMPQVFFKNIPPPIASNCVAFDNGDNSFIVTGRGGLPPSPDDFLSSDVVWSDTRLPGTTVLHSSKTPTAKSHSKPEVMAIIPATGWVLNDKGEVILISAASNATSLGFTPASCPRR